MAVLGISVGGVAKRRAFLFGTKGEFWGDKGGFLFGATSQLCGIKPG